MKADGSHPLDWLSVTPWACAFGDDIEFSRMLGQGTGPWCACRSWE